MLKIIGSTANGPVSKADCKFFEWLNSARYTHPPKLLGRFMDVPGTLATLRSGGLRWKCPLNFDDKLDCQWDTLWNVHSKEGWDLVQQAQAGQLLDDPVDWDRIENRKARQLISRLRLKYANLPQADRAAEVARIIGKLRTAEDATSDFQNRFASLRKRMRVLCFTQAVRDRTMWHDFAGGGTGALFLFRSRCLMWYWRRPLRPVRYVQQLPVVIPIEQWRDATLYGKSPKMPENAEELLMLTKLAIGFQREREWRFAAKQEQEQPSLWSTFRFLGGHLAAICLGPNAGGDFVNEICTIMHSQYPRAKIWQVHAQDGWRGATYRSVSRMQASET